MTLSLSKLRLAAHFLLASFLLATAALAQSAPLPSWKDGETKQAILDFVAAVTDDGGPDYVAPTDRIATFDNDGTLWVEQPMYTQLAFALDRIKAMAPDHPDWATTQPFQAVLENDVSALAASGQEGLLKIVAVTHAGMSTDEFSQIVSDWIEQAQHPKFGMPYTDLAYQPMLELLDYLRANGFKTFIVSGGGFEFMRPWTEKVYGIPSEQVIGSAIAAEYKVIDGKPQLIRMPELAFIDDKEGKPVGIRTHIGKRPIAAFGNSDGDYQMLEYTTAGDGKRLAMIVHHDDELREYAYDRESHFGKLGKGLDDAEPKGWHIISMKNDWTTIFAN